MATTFDSCEAYWVTNPNNEDEYLFVTKHNYEASFTFDDYIKKYPVEKYPLARVRKYSNPNDDVRL